MNYLKNILKVFLALALLIGFAACNNDKSSDKRDIQLLVDSTAYRNNASTDSARKRNIDQGDKIHREHEESNQNNSNSNNSSTSNSTQSSNKKG